MTAAPLTIRITAILAALLAILGLIACANSSQATAAPTPTPVTNVIDRNYMWLEQRPQVEYAAWGWTSHHKAELAEQLAQAILETAPFLDTSYSTQITRNAEAKVIMLEYSDADYPLSAIPAEINSTFTVDHPTEGGTYRATLPVSIEVDHSLPLEQMITGYSVASEHLSLERQYSR